MRQVFVKFLSVSLMKSQFVTVQSCKDGKLAGVGAHSYSEGNATGGSENAAGVDGNA